MRTIAFNIAYWIISIGYGLFLFALGFVKSPELSRKVAVSYSRAMAWSMTFFAGIRMEYRGLENLPIGEPVIFASKHQSWGDGYMIMAKLGDLAIVIGDFIEQYPLLPQILRNIGAIIAPEIPSKAASLRLKEAFETAKGEGRCVLIYPEGGLVKIGERKQYRTGIYRLQQISGWKVVPVATNLGLFWSCRAFKKEKGVAVNKFYAPIPAGLPREEFMKRLEIALNDGSRELFEEAKLQNPNLSQINADWPDAINATN